MSLATVIASGIDLVVFTELRILVGKVVLLLTVFVGRAETVGALFFWYTAAGSIGSAEAAGQCGVAFTTPDRLCIRPAAVS